MHDLLDRDYVLQSIDSGKHHDAKAVIQKIRTKGGGIPWMAIVDPTGKVLITSDGPKGNVGCPWEPHEIAWFREMLGKTKQKLTDADLDAIVKAIEAYRARVEAEAKRKQQEEKEKERGGDR